MQHQLLQKLSYDGAVLYVRKMTPEGAVSDGQLQDIGILTNGDSNSDQEVSYITTGGLSI